MMNSLNRLLTMRTSSPPSSSYRAWWPLMLVSVLTLIILTSCKERGSKAKPANVDYYTCTMHPSVKKQNPTDKCPICSMDLTPVLKKGSTTTDAQSVHAGHQEHPMTEMGDTNAPAEDKPTEFTVAVERQQQIGVTYGTIAKRPFTNAIRAVGVVAYDKQRHWDYV